MIWIASLTWAAPITVEADPTYETLSVLAYLAGFEEFDNNKNRTYVADVESHFRPHAEHEAVELARQLRASRGIGYNALSGLAAHIGHDFQPRVSIDPVPPRLDARWDDAEATKQFLEAAARFAKASDFDAFWQAQQPYIDAVEARFAERLADKDVVGWFDETFGPSKGASYRVVPGLLTGPNNYGSSVALPDGTVSYRPALGLWNLDKAGLPKVDESYELVLVHEFGHAYGNPVVGAHLDALGSVGDALYQLDPEGMNRQAYTGGKLVLGETLTRAFTVMYAHDRYGADGGASQLRDERARGFRWTNAVVQVLDAERAEGVLDLGALVPDLAKALEAWLADPPKVAFEGVINQVSTGPWASEAVLVAPPKSTTAGAHARAMHRMFFAKKGIRLVDAASHDLSSRNAVIAYGTAEDNPIIAKVAEVQGWSLSAQQLGFGMRTYTLEPGDLGVVLVAAVPHPEHPDLPVLIYTATSDAAMAEINGMFHGPTQWVVGEALRGKAPRPIRTGNLADLVVSP